jgi:uncharacterized iron-regulated membrane protein
MSDHKKHFDLSFPTVIGGAVAAATAAALSTRLGLMGTIVGAAVMNVVATVVATALTHWLERFRGAALERDPSPFRGLLIGTAAMALLAYGFHTGLDLVTSDLPRDAFATRLLAQFS